MGMGFAVAVPERLSDDALAALRGHRPKVVGRVERGKGVVHEPLGLAYAGY
jgi:phosphoribosylaminoimidazole (AIR) synthetase